MNKHYPVTAAVNTRCADGYREYNNKCWKFATDDTVEYATWDEARDACRRDNAELATINSQEEQDFVTYTIAECCGE